VKNRNIVIIVVFLAAIAAILLLPGSAKKGAGVPGAPGAAVAATGVGASGAGSTGPAVGSTFSVRTAAITRRTMQEYIELNGNIVIDASVKVYPQVAGEIRSVRVALGSEVKKGQLIAEIDPSTPGNAYAINSVYAPISGTVIASPMPVGSTVTTSSAIVELGDVAKTELETMVPERYVGVLKAGLKATAAFKAYPGESFSATVTRVSPVLDAASRTKTIRLAFDKADQRIDAGMFAKIKLDTVSHPNRLTVAEGAVLSDASGSYVFIVNDDSTISRRSVTTGVSVDETVELASGVAEGELVVIEGASVLVDGATIKDITVKTAETGASK
jgi:multidrug efflux pump subunit AcrA (membrane-fusion protein)